MLQKSIYTFILTLLVMVSFSQTATISGIVKDDEFVTLPDIQIAVLEDGNIFTTTDSKGNFSLEVPAGKEITISLYNISYKQISKKFNLKAGEKVGSSRVDLQACKLEYSIVSPK